MDKNTVVGFTLIFLLLLAMSWMKTPSQEEIERQKFVQDSIKNATILADSLAKLPEEIQPKETVPVLSDSMKNIQLAGKFGAFSPAASGEDQIVTLENDLMIVKFSTKGGKIKEVELKEHKKLVKDAEGNSIKTPLKLLEDEKNKFEYILPVGNKNIYTSDLYFTPQVSGKSISLKAQTSTGGFIEQKYTLEDGSYLMDYDVNLNNLGGVISRNEPTIKLNWVNYMDQLEKAVYYEATYSSVYYKTMDKDPSYCSCRGDDEQNLDKPLKWVSHAQQFFNSTLIADNKFKSADLETKMLDTEAQEDLKKIVSKINIPIDNADNESITMKFYVGPNDYNILKSYNIDLEDIIPFGWSIFGWVNRHVIRPMFNFLAAFIPNYGLLILVLTIILKTVLFPLQYKMLYSQVKMRVLKPELAKLKERIGDDPQKLQMEQMKMYRETGASPFSGCLPVMLQMPVWIALYRFFPAAIDFRQQPFLWADDLSSYDEIVQLGFSLPFLGSHISLFTVLWIISTIAYTYYNSKDMDFSAQPMMKYIQYFMPLMFIFIFNSYAAGLTCYLLFSSLINISQIIITKNFIIDHDKVRAEIAEHRKKPKKAGFAQKLEKVMKEQQAQQEKLAKQKNQAKKKRK